MPTLNEGVKRRGINSYNDSLAEPVRVHVEHNKITTNHGSNGFISKVQKYSAGLCVPRICSKRCGGKEMAKG